MSTDWPEQVSVILPTFRRPDGLATALASLSGQSAIGLPIELVVVDNDPGGSAESAVADYSETAPFPVIYVHEPNPGVSNARNAALAAASGRYLAFLDDDQEAGPDWLEELLQTLQAHGAVLAFCPTDAIVPNKGRDEAFMVDFFSRNPELSDGLTYDVFGCGNSILDRNIVALPEPAFDPASNELGGEDDILFAYLIAQGGKIAWTNTVRAKEYIRPHRATRNYVWIRSYAFGQGHALYAFEATPRDWFGVIKWMGIGIGQTIIFGLISAITWATRRPSFLNWSARFCDAIGKVFWPRIFHPRLYGAAMARRKGIN